MMDASPFIKAFGAAFETTSARPYRRVDQDPAWILERIANGYTVKQLALEAGVGVGWMQHRVRRLQDRYGCATREQMIARYVRGELGS